MESGSCSVDLHDKQGVETPRDKRKEHKKSARTLAEMMRPIYRGTPMEKLAQENENIFLHHHRTFCLDPSGDDVHSYVLFAMDSYNRRLQQAQPHKYLQLVKVLEVMYSYELKTGFHMIKLEAKDHVGNEGVYRAIVITFYLHPKFMGLVGFYLYSGSLDVNEANLFVQLPESLTQAVSSKEHTTLHLCLDELSKEFEQYAKYDGVSYILRYPETFPVRLDHDCSHPTTKEHDVPHIGLDEQIKELKNECKSSEEHATHQLHLDGLKHESAHAKDHSTIKEHATTNIKDELINAFSEFADFDGSSFILKYPGTSLLGLKTTHFATIAHVEIAIEDYNAVLKKKHPHKFVQLGKVLTVKLLPVKRVYFYYMTFMARDQGGNESVFQATWFVSYGGWGNGLLEFYLISGTSGAMDEEMRNPVLDKLSKDLVKSTRLGLPAVTFDFIDSAVADGEPSHSTQPSFPSLETKAGELTSREAWLKILSSFKK